MIKISVIAPVYKVEKYLPECIESILSQTFTDFELILVDDGSPDGSGAICDEYARKDNRIIVIHKENGGVTSARKQGVESSKGEWILFVDSDDKLPIDALERMCNSKYENADIVIGNFAREDGIVPWIKQERLITSESYIQLMLEAKLHRAPFARLIKKTLITKNVFDIPRKIVLGEDVIANIRMVKPDTRIQLIPDCVYFYRNNEESVVSTFKMSAEYGKTFYEMVLSDLAFWKMDSRHKSVQVFGIYILGNIYRSFDIKKEREFIKRLIRHIELRTCNTWKKVVWLSYLKVRYSVGL